MNTKLKPVNLASCTEIFKSFLREVIVFKMGNSPPRSRRSYSPPPDYHCCVDSFVISSNRNITCRSMHVSCDSHGWESGEDYAGLVFYHKNGDINFYYGGKHMQCGYIMIAKSSAIRHMNSGHGQVHGDCFKVLIQQVFLYSSNQTSFQYFFPNLGKSVREALVEDGLCITGFAYQDGQFKFGSRTVNHTGYICPPAQQGPIQAAVQNYWNGRGQNLSLSWMKSRHDEIYKMQYRNICCELTQPPVVERHNWSPVFCAESERPKE